MPHIAGFRGVIAGERETTRAVYRYHQRFSGGGRTFERKNALLAVQLSPFADGMVRPHEMTTAAGRDAELARIRDAKAHVEPVVAGFRDPATEVDRLFRKFESGRPTLEVTTPDGTLHRLWRIQDAELLGKLRHYLTPKKLHVLDGHDRYEAMLAYRDELGAKASLAQYSSANYALACLVSLDDAALATAPRHRVIRAELVIDEVLEKAKKYFLVDKLAGAARDPGKLLAALGDSLAHQPAFVLAVSTGDAYKLTLSPDVSAFTEGVTAHRALQKLDPVIADGLFVGRSLPAGTQVTTTTDLTEALATLDKGAAVVVMRPLSVEQIAHVDELGQLLPAGSTAFFPPVASLVTMPIDPDEDLV
jgi:uncharacterized protein (DUF1015 family)